MFASIIQYRLNPIFEPDFLRAWKQQRDWLQQEGLVSIYLLHRETRISYIAYARWHQRQDFEDFMYRPAGQMKVWWDKIEECCNSVTIPYQLHLLQDIDAHD